MAEAKPLRISSHRSHLGRVTITGILNCQEGIHFGAGKGGIGFAGDVDMPIVRHPITMEPYGPGSSMKGKTADVALKSGSTRLRFFDGALPRHYDTAAILHLHGNNPDLRCPSRDAADACCPYCRVFGVAASVKGSGSLQGVQFADMYLHPESKQRLAQMDTIQPYAEEKKENVISRVTGEATPRTVERVPAGSQFLFQMDYDIREGINFVDDILFLLETLNNVDEYGHRFGGNASRGYGRVTIPYAKIKFSFSRTGNTCILDSPYQDAKSLNEVMSQLWKHFSDGNTALTVAGGPIGYSEVIDLERKFARLTRLQVGLQEPQAIDLLAEWTTFFTQLLDLTGENGEGWRIEGSSDEFSVNDSQTIMLDLLRGVIGVLFTPQWRVHLGPVGAILSELFPPLDLSEQLIKERMKLMDLAYAKKRQGHLDWYWDTLNRIIDENSEIPVDDRKTMEESLRQLGTPQVIESKENFEETFMRLVEVLGRYYADVEKILRTNILGYYHGMVAESES